jgi:hypothetical protein
MEQPPTIGLDLAKNVVQGHGVDTAGAVVCRCQVRRPQVLVLFARLSPCRVGMEACAGADHGARHGARALADRLPDADTRRAVFKSGLCNRWLAGFSSELLSRGQPAQRNPACDRPLGADASDEMGGLSPDISGRGPDDMPEAP